MYSIRPLIEFTAWIDALKDEMVRGVIVARIKRLERGLMRDAASVSDGVSELRIRGRGLTLVLHQAEPADRRVAGGRLEAYANQIH